MNLRRTPEATPGPLAPRIAPEPPPERSVTRLSSRAVDRPLGATSCPSRRGSVLRRPCGRDAPRRRRYSRRPPTPEGFEGGTFPSRFFGIRSPSSVPSGPRPLAGHGPFGFGDSRSARRRHARAVRRSSRAARRPVRNDDTMRLLVRQAGGRDQAPSVPALAIRLSPRASRPRSRCRDRSLQASCIEAHAELPAWRWLPLDPDGETLIDIDTRDDLDRLNAT